MMASFDLPRALQDYFSFAETTPTREGRRFCITMPYLRPDGRIDRLQWWYHLSPGQEKILGEEAVATLRAQAIDRFTSHIDRWLQNTAQMLCGDGPIPNVVVRSRGAGAAEAVNEPNPPAQAMAPQIAAQPMVVEGAAATRAHLPVDQCLAAANMRQ